VAEEQKPVPIAITAMSTAPSEIHNEMWRNPVWYYAPVCEFHDTQCEDGAATRPLENREVDLKNKPSSRGAPIASWVGDERHCVKFTLTVSHRANAERDDSKPLGRAQGWSLFPVPFR